jgi:hypothetical protein
MMRFETASRPARGAPAGLALALAALAPMAAASGAAASGRHHALNVASLAAPSAPAPVSKLPVFDFKGVTAGQTIDPKTLGACEAEAKPGELKCRLHDTTVAGIASTDGPMMSFYNGRLTALHYEFSVHDFIQLESALHAKYGPSCRTEHTKYENELGSTLVNLVEAWCFASGDLILSAMDSGPETGALDYADTLAKAPTNTAHVDF